jgi:hypothetical protein
LGQDVDRNGLSWIVTSWILFIDLEMRV